MIDMNGNNEAAAEAEAVQIRCQRMEQFVEELSGTPIANSTSQKKPFFPRRHVHSQSVQCPAYLVSTVTQTKGGTKLHEALIRLIITFILLICKNDHRRPAEP